MATVEVSTPMVGEIITLSESNVSNWASVITFIEPDENCTFKVTYDGTEYTGTILRSTDGLNLALAFNSPVTLPSGMCLGLSCESSESEDECPNVSQQVTDETKLAVLGEDGCQIGFITVADLKAEIVSGLPTSLCDLLGVSEIPSGSLTASDRILTTSGGCTMKSVPQSDIKCP